jgi:hypothetical protein
MQYMFVLFHIRIRATLAKRFVSYVGMFTSNSVQLFGTIYLLSIVDGLVALTMWNQVLQSRDELVCYRVSVVCNKQVFWDFLGDLCSRTSSGLFCSQHRWSPPICLSLYPVCFTKTSDNS